MIFFKHRDRWGKRITSFRSERNAKYFFDFFQDNLSMLINREGNLSNRRVCQMIIHKRSF